MIIAETGHGPRSLGGYEEEIRIRVLDLAIACLKKFQPSGVIRGMALGWDQAIAEAAFILKIPYAAAIPFDGYGTVRPEESQDRYHSLLDKAYQVVVVNESLPVGIEISPEQKKARGKWMVENSDMLLALWNEKPGGVADCVKYAKKKGKPVVNVWSSWVRYK
jgi:uncharacterized phage-like protein YoqJ